MKRLKNNNKVNFKLVKEKSSYVQCTVYLRSMYPLSQKDKTNFILTI